MFCTICIEFPNIAHKRLNLVSLHFVETNKDSKLKASHVAKQARLVKAVHENEKRKLGAQEVGGTKFFYNHLCRPSLLRAIWCSRREPITNSRQSFKDMKFSGWILAKIITNDRAFKICCSNIASFLRLAQGSRYKELPNGFHQTWNE